MTIKEDKLPCFIEDQFKKIEDIREEFRNIEQPKTIYGRLSILLNILAQLIVNIDDKHSDIKEIYTLLINICAESQYFCEQINLCKTQLNKENEESLYKTKYEHLVKQVNTFLNTFKPQKIVIQKNEPSKLMYELDPVIMNSLASYL